MNGWDGGNQATLKLKIKDPRPLVWPWITNEQMDFGTTPLLAHMWHYLTKQLSLGLQNLTSKLPFSTRKQSRRYCALLMNSLSSQNLTTPHPSTGAVMASQEFETFEVLAVRCQRVPDGCFLTSNTSCPIYHSADGATDIPTTLLSSQQVRKQFQSVYIKHTLILANPHTAHFCC